MKLTAIIFMMSVLGVAFATPYVMKRIQSGDSGVSLSQYTPPASSTQTRQTFYKWQDANGQWHFGNEAPEGVEAIPVNIDTAANILAPVATQEEKPTDSQLISPEPAIPDSPVVMPSQALELIDQAKQVKSMLESRYSSENES
jgi:hypothetical protein